MTHKLIRIDETVIGNIASSNLVAHYDANAITGLSDGDKIDQRNDESGNSNNLLEVTTDNIYVMGYTGVSAWFGTGGGTTNPQSRTFADGGTRVYASQNETVYQYDLSSAYDISSLSFVRTFDFESINADQDDGVNIQLSASGDKLFFLNSNRDAVYEYDLSTNWDISTASYNNVFFELSVYSNVPNRFYIGDNGNKLYYHGPQNNTVFQFSFGTAWDLSTISYDSKSYNFSAVATVPRGLAFNNAGTKMVIGDSPNALSEYVYQFDLSTPRDVSTANYNNDFGGELFVYDQERTPTGVYFKHTDDDYLYVGGRTNDGIFEYLNDRRPTYKTNVQNGLPAVRFDDAFYQKLSLPAPLNFGKESTMIWVAKQNNNQFGTRGEIFGNNASSYFIRRASNSILIYSHPSAYRQYGSLDFSATTIFSLVRDGEDRNFYQQYVNKTISTIGGSNFDEDGLFINIGGEVEMFNGDIYEVLIYDKVLTSDELYNAITLLKYKYNINA